MTNRILLASSTAIAMLMAGPAMSQTQADTEAEASITAQAADVAEEVAETGYAIGETATDTMQAGIDAIGGVVEDGYGGASNLSAEMDAALTNDAKVYSSDGELIGTLTRTDASGQFAIVDLDGEMEGADARPVENMVIQLQNMIVGVDGLMVPMTEAQMKADLQASPRVSLGG